MNFYFFTVKTSSQFHNDFLRGTIVFVVHTLLTLLRIHLHLFTLIFLALFNLYVHTLTFLYYPSNLSEEGISMTDMEQLNDEEEGEENVERDGGESGFDSASI